MRFEAIGFSKHLKVYTIVVYGILSGLTHARAETTVLEGAAGESEFTATSSQLDGALTKAMPNREAFCRLDYLKSLGWRVIESPSNQVEIVDGSPCSRDSLASSQSAGELTIALPKNPSAADFAKVTATLGELLKTNATVCAYKLKVAVAAKHAIDQLKANSDNYRFVVTSGTSIWQNRHIPTGFVDLGIGGGIRMGWKPLDGFLALGGLAYTPRSSNWDAIESFYHKTARSECAAGLQLAEFAAQKELYGKEDFDRAFTNDEIVIGTWGKVSNSNSATRGKHTGTVISDAYGEQAALLGGMALVGRTGYFGNVFGESYLDDKPNRGENLIVASITREASLEFRKAGGVKKFNQMLRTAWDLRTENTKLDPKKDAVKISENNSKISEILTNPFLSGVKTHTHPYNRYYSYSQLFEIVYDANPRTPYQITFYEDVVNYGLYDRYENYSIAKCLAAH
jgi:hypothetical protein